MDIPVNYPNQDRMELIKGMYEYSFLIGHFTYNYFLIDEVCIKKILRIKKLNAEDIDAKMKNYSCKPPTIQEYVKCLLTKFLDIKEKRKIILHGLYILRGNGYAIKKMILIQRSLNILAQVWKFKP